MSAIGARQLSSLGFLLFCVGIESIVIILIGFTLACALDDHTIGAIREKVAGFFKWPVGLAVPAACILLMYYKTIYFPFFADDYNALKYFSSGLWKSILPLKDTYHYYPVLLFLIGTLRWLGLGDASTYHFINIVMHCINTSLVYMLAFSLYNSRFHAFGASVLFAFFFLSYNPILWPLGGFQYVISAFFVLISFLSFLHYRKGGSRRHLIGFVVFYILSIFTNEICIPLLGGYLFYDFLQKKGGLFPVSLKHAVSTLKIYIVPIAAIGLILAIKVLYTARIAVSYNSIPQVLQNLVSAACFLFPLNNMNAYWLFSRLGQNGIFSIAASIATLIFGGLLFTRVGWREKVMLSWCAFGILPAILLSQLAPRYFYIPAVGWSVLLAGLIKSAANRISQMASLKTGRFSQESTEFLVLCMAGLIYGCIAIQGQQHMAHSIDIWSRGSDIINKTVDSTIELIRQNPSKKRIIVVDQPTWHREDDFYGAPLLITSMREVIASLNHPEYGDGREIESVRLRIENFFDKSFPKVSYAEVEKASLNPDTLVIIYDNHRQCMVPFESFSD